MTIKLKLTATRFIRKYGTDWNDISDIFIINLEGTNLSKVKFPNDPDFFQKVHNKSISNTIMPPLDYSIYNFNNVNFEKARFHRDAILPKDTSLFQKIKNKSLEFCELPKGDYSNYNFTKVRLMHTKFTPDSIFSSDTEPIVST